jgi:hypothetical protein
MALACRFEVAAYSGHSVGELAAAAAGDGRRGRRPHSPSTRMPRARLERSRFVPLPYLDEMLETRLDCAPRWLLTPTGGRNGSSGTAARVVFGFSGAFLARLCRILGGRAISAETRRSTEPKVAVRILSGRTGARPCQTWPYAGLCMVCGRG